MTEINTPHNDYFETMLSNKNVAKDFLRWHLPDFIKDRIVIVCLPRYRFQASCLRIDSLTAEPKLCSGTPCVRSL